MKRVFNPSPRKVNACFRLMHDSLIPTDISKILEIEPSLSHRKGDENISAKGKRIGVHLNGIWLLETTRTFAKNADEHIDFLYQKLKGKRKEIKTLIASGYCAEIICGWFASGENTAPCLNVQSIKKLAELEVEFWFDVYFANEIETNS